MKNQNKDKKQKFDKKVARLLAGTVAIAPMLSSMPINAQESEDHTYEYEEESLQNELWREEDLHEEDITPSETEPDEDEEELDFDPSHEMPDALPVERYADDDDVNENRAEASQLEIAPLSNPPSGFTVSGGTVTISSNWQAGWDYFVANWDDNVHWTEVYLSNENHQETEIDLSTGFTVPAGRTLLIRRWSRGVVDGWNNAGPNNFTRFTHSGNVAITVENGATLALHEAIIEGNNRTGTGVLVNQGGSFAMYSIQAWNVPRRSFIRGFNIGLDVHGQVPDITASAISNNNTGIRINDGGYAELRAITMGSQSVAVSGNDVGVHINSGGHLHVNQASPSLGNQPFWQAVIGQTHAGASGPGLPGNDVGVLVDGSNARFTLEAGVNANRHLIMNNNGMAIQISNGGTVDWMGGRIPNSTGPVSVAVDNGTFNLSSGNSEPHIQNPGETAVEVSNGGVFNLYDGFVQNANRGVHVTDANSAFNMYRGQITNAHTGIDILNDATAIMRDSLLQNNGIGVRVGNGTFEMIGSTITENSVRGIEVNSLTDLEQVFVDSNSEIANNGVGQPLLISDRLFDLHHQIRPLTVTSGLHPNGGRHGLPNPFNNRDIWSNEFAIESTLTVNIPSSGLGAVTIDDQGEGTLHTPTSLTIWHDAAGAHIPVTVQLADQGYRMSNWHLSPYGLPTEYISISETRPNPERFEMTQNIHVDRHTEVTVETEQNTAWVTMDRNDGTGGNIDGIGQTVEESGYRRALRQVNREVLVTPPIRHDYIFLGWDMIDASGEIVTGPYWNETTNRLRIPDFDVTLIARWQADRIYIEMDDDQNVVIIAPPGVEYDIDQDDPYITIVFPPGTDREDIEVNLPPGWEYQVVEDDDDYMIITLMPPLPDLGDLVTLTPKVGPTAPDLGDLVTLTPEVDPTTPDLGDLVTPTPEVDLITPDLSDLVTVTPEVDSTETESKDQTTDTSRLSLPETGAVAVTVGALLLGGISLISGLAIAIKKKKKKDD